MNLVNTATILALLLGVVIPHLTALVSGTKAIPAWAGGYVTLVLSAVTGYLTEWQLNPHQYDWKTGALNSAVALIFAFLTHTNVLKNTPVQGKLLSFGSPKGGAAPAAPPQQAAA